MTNKKDIAKIVDKKVNTRNARMIDNTQRQGETLGSVGPFVKVTWNDAASTFKTYVINGDNPSEHLTVCETVGELVAQDDKALVLVMHGSQCDGCDIMAIPTDWAQSIEVLESVGTALDNWKELKECISENLEHQQESEDAEVKKKSNNK
jgi:aspartate 1-decarboxylase